MNSLIKGLHTIQEQLGISENWVSLLNVFRWWGVRKGFNRLKWALFSLLPINTLTWPTTGDIMRMAVCEPRT